LHRWGRIVPILVVVVRPVIQIGVIVRIPVRVPVGIPVKRQENLLRKETMVATKKKAISTKPEITANSGSRPECHAATMRNEPAAKTAAVEPSADRARVRPGGEQKDAGDQAHNGQRDFHTINLPSNSATILGGIASSSNIVTHSSLSIPMDLARFLTLPPTPKAHGDIPIESGRHQSK
jgi:hypothetical protein